MKRRKRTPTPGPEFRYDYTKLPLGKCALLGHGECGGARWHVALLDEKAMAKNRWPMPPDLVVTLCDSHRDLCSRDSMRAEQLGCRVPMWVWARAPLPPQQIFIVKEAQALRSTARSVPVGEMRLTMFPFWQENEKRKWEADQRVAAAIAARDRSFDIAHGIIDAEVIDETT